MWRSDSDSDKITQSPAATHNNHTIVQQYSDRSLLHHLKSPTFAVNNITLLNITQWVVFQLAVNDVTQTNAITFLALNYCHLNFTTVLESLTCTVHINPFYNTSPRPTRGVEVYLYSFSNLDTRWGWVVNASPRLLFSRRKSPVHIEYLGTRTGLYRATPFPL